MGLFSESHKLSEVAHTYDSSPPGMEAKIFGFLTA